MKLIRQDTGEALELPYDLYPTDELNGQTVTHNAKRAVSGKLIVQTAVKIGGMAITLQSADEETGVIQRWQLETLITWANITGLKFWYEREMPTGIVQTLVMFNCQDKAVESTPVKKFNSPYPDDYFTVKINLLEINP